MKIGRGYTNNAGTGQIDKLQRNAYLNSKGINPSTQFQLAPLFPETLGSRDDLRHTFRTTARSSLFTARYKSQKRKTLMHEKLFHFNEFV
jgi:hypothetical protein